MAELTKPPAMADSDLDRIAFGKLSDAQIAGLADVAARRHFADGETLFAAGERGFKFFVVESGEVEIIERSSCEAKTVTVHGPGEFTGDVLLLLRGADLRRSMSSYLAERIEAADDVDVLLHTEVSRMLGDERLRAVEIRDRETGATRTVGTPAVFTFIGAVPRTEWLPVEIETDAKGFVRTGRAVATCDTWVLEREPFLLETSHPGVFAAGDVRLGSIKRVASAVGEGSMAVKFAHEYLREA